MTSLFVLEGATAIPSELTQGPWMAGAQHGGPPSALLTVLLESIARPDQFIARINVELLAPVPLTPLTIATSVEQVSRRVGIGFAELLSEGTIVARATGRLLTTGEAPPTPVVQSPSAAVSPDDLQNRGAPAWAVGKNAATFHRDAVEYRWVSGDFSTAGPALCWQRLAVSIVEGIDLTGHQRVMAVADIASGISAIYPPAAGYGLINSDLDVAFVRPAEGEWTLADATTLTADNATGLCRNTISDRRGVVAIGTQTLLGRAFTFE